MQSKIMKTQTTLQKATGKPLSDCAESQCGQILLIFGDEYVCLGVCSGYERGDEEIEESELDLFDFGDETLIEKGVISREELENRRANRNAQFQRQIEERERASYMRLRAKFETNS